MPGNIPTVQERGLVKTNIKASVIFSQYKAYSTSSSSLNKRNLNTTVLGYVTPWNNRGYDIAKWFTKKFTHISPVWLQARLNSDDSDFDITGQHDIDQGWIRELRNNNPNIKIGRFFSFNLIQFFNLIFCEII